MVRLNKRVKRWVVASSTRGSGLIKGNYCLSVVISRVSLGRYGMLLRLAIARSLLNWMEGRFEFGVGLLMAVAIWWRK